VYLSLNQGTTAVREEFGSKAKAVLSDRAELMVKASPTSQHRFPLQILILVPPNGYPAIISSTSSASCVIKRARPQAAAL
jgi:hypothetical protein